MAESSSSGVVAANAVFQALAEQAAYASALPINSSIDKANVWQSYETHKPLKYREAVEALNTNLYEKLTKSKTTYSDTIPLQNIYSLSCAVYKSALSSQQRLCQRFVYLTQIEKTLDDRIEEYAKMIFNASSIVA